MCITTMTCESIHIQVILYYKELLTYKTSTSLHSAQRKFQELESRDLTEVGASYTFFWKGKAADERREAGDGFAIYTVLLPKLGTLP